MTTSKYLYRAIEKDGATHIRFFVTPLDFYLADRRYPKWTVGTESVTKKGTNILINYPEQTNTLLLRFF